MAEIEKSRACQHPFCGCISCHGGECSNIGPDLKPLPCAPMDENGNRFEIRYLFDKDGQRYLCRDFRHEPAPRAVKPVGMAAEIRALIDKQAGKVVNAEQFQRDRIDALLAQGREYQCTGNARVFAHRLTITEEPMEAL